ncbi:hypothetical protein [Nonomuraea rhodomycinica]|uniref:Uncharacterized protein n=1 Tax=Nonomuraea rhodomycinica TaxID=1712872 RepID=A0A7Y6IXY7_9ACTN|nr:hypothetical protein [Nonomuraea rhodomycinica]NUW46484.1 hypothetical protein [Nonomuraea rhodomycinica]
MISINMSATQWLASACRDTVRLADGPAKLRQEKSARSQAPVYARVHLGAAAPSAPAFAAGADVPTQQITKGGMRGPQPWRDAPVTT